jgi:NSS family neurotransmitter:Na+ symporter
VAYWEETHNTNRGYTATICGVAIAILGVLSALSFNALSGVKIGDLTIFGLLDTITSQALLPLGGTLIALFFGWVLGKRAIKMVLKTDKEQLLSSVILWCNRAIAPLAILGAIGYQIYKLLTS